MVELAGFLNPTGIDALVLIAAVWVNPQADDETLVHENNRTATRDALAAAAGRLPTLDEALEYRDRALSAYYLRPG